MSENSFASAATSDTHKSSSAPSSAPSSPASSAKDSSTPIKSSTPSASSSSATKGKSDSKPAAGDSHKREGSGSSLSSLKASLEKVKSVTTASSNSDSSAATPSSTSSSTNWTSVLTFGLASSKGKADLSEWMPDLTDRLPSNIFTVPPPQEDGKPAQPALPADAITAEFPNFTSLLPPPPPPSSALRFGWIDEYGDYHPAAINTTGGKLNLKLQKAREQAKELIANVMASQEKLEKDKEPHSPRMSTVVKERLSIEGEKRDSRGQGVERLVQVVEGSKGEKKVVVTEDEKVPEDL